MIISSRNTYSEDTVYEEYISTFTEVQVQQGTAETFHRDGTTGTSKLSRSGTEAASKQIRIVGSAESSWGKIFYRARVVSFKVPSIKIVKVKESPGVSNVGSII